MKTNTRNWLRRAGSTFLAAAMGVSMVFGATAETGASANKYFNDYNTMDEAVSAAAALNIELSEEGNVLLKNNGLLPLNGNERVSVFGISQDNLVGGSGSNAVMAGNSTGESAYGVADALMEAGFNVNPTLRNFYIADTSDYGAETLAFTGEAKNSMEVYDDVAVIVISREGGEGADLETVMTELVPVTDDHLSLKKCKDSDYDAKYEGNADYFDADGYHYHKHYLMLTDSEEELIDYVTARFENVVLVVNTTNTIELGDLQNSDAISAIINIERPGETGIKALAEIMNGTVSPSGHLVDLWAADLTTDPTWYNITYNEQNNSSNMYVKADGTSAVTKGADNFGGMFGDDKSYYFGVDYEEGIYLGYKYYETYYYDIYNGNQPIPAGYEGMTKEEAAAAWYADHVTYTFGYGMSYTTFSMNAGALYTDEALTAELGTAVDAAQFSSEAGSEAAVKTLYLPVTVTNTGDVAGKEVVQAYVTAPYTAGGIEKASATLAGYAKTSLLKPGQSETVIVSFNVQDFASWDYNDANADGVQGDYELDAGTYTVRVMESAHYDCSVDTANQADAYDEVSFELSATAHQHLDDFSGNEVSNKFSAENGVYDENAEGHTMYYNSVRTADLMADEQYAEVIMSRADMAATFPKAPVYNVTRDADGNVTAVEGDLVFKQGAVDNWYYYDSFNLQNGYTDQKTDAWYIDDDTLATLMTGWTQEQANGLTISDMTGVDWDDESWTALLNEMTWDELCSVVEQGGYSTAAVESIGKAKEVDADGPNNFNSTYIWCDETTISSTWNVDLAEKEGRLVACLGIFSGATGWYGPGMDVHRSPFSGRNNEYYSQDGIQGGYIAAAVVKGAESKGIVCYIKHLAFNDQETCRDGKVQFTWITEQAMRENYLKMFQMAIQEGGSSGAMTGYARIGGIPNTSDKNLLTGVLQNEWGWHGYLVTDGYIGWMEATELDLMVRAGNSLELYTSPFVEELSGEWDAEANSVRINTTDGASYISNLQYYYVRESAKSILYERANSVGVQNGFLGVTLSGGDYTADQFMISDKIFVGLSAETLADSTATYAITAGVLPDGMTMTAGGVISGKPTVSGTYSFTVTATIDGYVTKTADYTMTVVPAFYTDEDWDALDSAKVGTSFETRIESKIFSTANGFDSVVYSVTAGTLPDGLTLSEDGRITGTPTTAGTYPLTVTATAAKTVVTVNFIFGEQTSVEYTEGTYDITIVVGE